MGVRPEQDYLERTAMRMLRWMMEIKRIKEFRTRIKARAGVAKISQKINQARLRRLKRVERKTEVDGYDLIHLYYLGLL